MWVFAFFVVAACGGGKSSEPKPTRFAPPLTDRAMRDSMCKACDPERSTCELMVGAGAYGGTPATTGGCGALPDECRGETDCGCFPALKGCRCEYAAGRFDIECPAP